MARQNIDELAKSVNLPNKRTKQVVEDLYKSILISLYRYDIGDLKSTDPKEKEEAEFNREMNDKVCAVYEKKFNKKFNPEIHAKNKNLPMFLMGPPGQGKTASYIAAAKKVCADLGLKFIGHITDDYVPKRNHFAMVVQECAGENSAITFGGVPKAEEIEINGKKVSVLKKALNYRFTVFERCAGGVLLFDDAANAAQVIQNVLLPVAQNQTFQGLALKNCHVGFTGNLGALDGTYTTELSSALRTRVIPVFVTDTVKDFANRAYEYYNDELGDLGIINFLFRNDKDFSVLPDPSEKSGFACSRSWDNLIQSIRSVVEMNGGRGKGEAESLETIQQLCKSMVGPEIGTKLVAYFQSMIMGADPLARNFMNISYAPGEKNKEKLDNLIQEFKKKYSHGASAEDISFGYQFATACGDYVTNFIVSSGKPEEALKEAMSRFGTAVLQLNDSEFSFSLEHLKNKLAAYVTDFSQPTKDGNRELKTDIKTKIATYINDLDDCNQTRRNILIKVITDYDKISNATGISKAMGPRKRME